MEVCKTCRWYQKKNSQLNQGHCHYNPPQLFGILAGRHSVSGQPILHVQNEFPTVQADGIGCSKHELANVPEIAEAEF